jgi:hypothetical protein
MPYASKRKEPEGLCFGLQGSERQAMTIQTTLYDLIEALYTEIKSEEESLIVPTVMHLLRSGRITFLDPTEGYLYEENHA